MPSRGTGNAAVTLDIRSTSFKDKRLVLQSTLIQIMMFILPKFKMIKCGLAH